MKYTAPCDEHNAIMLAATALDVRYRLVLNPLQTESAKKLLMEEVCMCTCVHGYVLHINQSASFVFLMGPLVVSSSKCLSLPTVDKIMKL